MMKPLTSTWIRDGFQKHCHKVMFLEVFSARPLMTIRNWKVRIHYGRMFSKRKR